MAEMNQVRSPREVLRSEIPTQVVRVSKDTVLPESSGNRHAPTQAVAHVHHHQQQQQQQKHIGVPSLFGSDVVSRLSMLGAGFSTVVLHQGRGLASRGLVSAADAGARLQAMCVPVHSGSHATELLQQVAGDVAPAYDSLSWAVRNLAGSTGNDDGSAAVPAKLDGASAGAEGESSSCSTDEGGIGRRALHLLRKMDVRNVLVVVAQQEGTEFVHDMRNKNDRFKLIFSVVKAAIRRCYDMALVYLAGVAGASPHHTPEHMYGTSNATAGEQDADEQSAGSVSVDSRGRRRGERRRHRKRRKGRRWRRGDGPRESLMQLHLKTLRSLHVPNQLLTSDTVGFPTEHQATVTGSTVQRIVGQVRNVNYAGEADADQGYAPDLLPQRVAVSALATVGATKHSSSVDHIVAARTVSADLRHHYQPEDQRLAAEAMEEAARGPVEQVSPSADAIEELSTRLVHLRNPARSVSAEELAPPEFMESSCNKAPRVLTEKSLRLRGLAGPRPEYEDPFDNSAPPSRTHHPAHAALLAADDGMLVPPEASRQHLYHKQLEAEVRRRRFGAATVRKAQSRAGFSSALQQHSGSLQHSASAPFFSGAAAAGALPSSSGAPSDRHGHTYRVPAVSAFPGAPGTDEGFPTSASGSHSLDLESAAPLNTVSQLSMVGMPSSRDYADAGVHYRLDHGGHEQPETTELDVKARPAVLTVQPSSSVLRERMEKVSKAPKSRRKRRGRPFRISDDPMTYLPRPSAANFEPPPPPVALEAAKREILRQAGGPGGEDQFTRWGAGPSSVNSGSLGRKPGLRQTL